MSLLEIFYALEYSPLLVEMRSSPWLFPAIATAHLFGLTMIGGAVLLVDLRLLGLGLSIQPAARVANALQPLLLAGIGVMLPTGILLFLCFATKYYYLAPFWVKLSSLILVLTFTFTVRRRVLQHDAGEASPTARRAVALISISLWSVVALGGRLIGFP